MRIKGLLVIVVVIILVPLVTSLALARPATHVHLQADEPVELTEADNELLEKFAPRQRISAT